MKIIWEGDLRLPPGRPAGQEVQITFGYDENQIMQCSFVDVATGRETKVDLGKGATENESGSDIEKFMVE